MNRKLWAIIARGAAANSISQAVNIIIQLATLPILLTFWSVEQYGAWLILSAIPAYFAMADFGMLTIASNKMTASHAQKDIKAANKIFQTALKFCCYQIGVGATVAIALVAIYYYLNEPIASALTLAFLIVSTLLAMSGGVIDSVFRANNAYAMGTLLLNIPRAAEWLGLLVGAAITKSFVGAAAGQLIGRASSSIFLAVYTARKYKNYTWSTKEGSTTEIKNMLRPSLAYLAFPVGNSLSIQGMTIAVATMFGPTAAAVFGAYRTASRITVQLTTILNRAIWPELTRAWATDNFPAVKKITKGAIYATTATAVACTVTLTLVGEKLIQRWSHGKIPYDHSIFTIMLIAALISCLWQPIQISLVAANKHRDISAIFLLACAIPPAWTTLAANYSSTTSAAYSIVISEAAILIGTFYLYSRALDNSNREAQA
ncbi:MAG: hypothetical protein RJA98_594 [Pseudomonadota bacterium]|jgi:O-antigen/teichoic acid export membrane protein